MSQHERSRSTGSRPAMTHRYSAPHPNSSAFSASANANEDWTKISDLAERRRIQNRIAQRNYRKKLKKRLEDLERRASASPEPETHQSAQPRSSRQPLQPVPTTTARYSPDRYSQSPEPSYARPDRPSYLELPDDRHMSRVQPSFSYSSFGGCDNGTGPYPHSPALSSYSVPSPALSAVSYGNSSYLSTGFRSESSVSSPTETTPVKTEYFGGHGYAGELDYGYGIVDNQKRHLSAPSAYSSYPDANQSYKHEFDDAFDSFDSSLHGSPLSDMWSMYPQPIMEEPPFFQL